MTNFVEFRLYLLRALAADSPTPSYGRLKGKSQMRPDSKGAKFPKP